ncbi:MAG: hypothetical protein KUA30_10680, partial [Candidatus Desulforudis sp.]|nr:hypothetical protein [Desulforudis sp.]
MPEGSPVLLKALEKLKGFAAKGGNTFAVTLLEESILKMRKESFTLVIMGEFKRGKSTFINALLGTDLV